MKYENDTFPEAIKILADRAGVKLPEVEETPEQKKKAGKRMRLLEVNKEAAKYFYYMLRDPRGEVGMRYLTGRKLTDASFRTGLCREKRRAGGTVPAEKGLYGRRDQRLRTGNVF
jgi:DNA primase